MEDVITVLVLAIAAYLLFKISIAMIKGLGLYGKSIQENGPAFFKDVWKSIITGGIAALLVAYMSDGQLLISGGTGVGVALFTAMRG